MVQRNCTHTHTAFGEKGEGLVKGKKIIVELNFMHLKLGTIQNDNIEINNLV